MTECPTRPYFIEFERVAVNAIVLYVPEYEPVILVLEHDQATVWTELRKGANATSAARASCNTAVVSRGGGSVTQTKRPPWGSVQLVSGGK